MEINWSVWFGASSGALAIGIWQISILRRELTRLRNEKAAVESRALTAEAQVAVLQTQIKGHQDDLEATRRQLHLEIETFNRRWLEQSQDRLQKWSKENFASLVEPVDREIKALQSRIQDVYDKESRERLSLKTELEFMMKAQAQMSFEAQSLTKALKGDSRTQGHWGEVVLERILESSGLREDEEYIVQGRGLGLKNEPGQARRPDILVRLPGERHLIVDSKVSLASYELHVRASTDQDRQLAADEFVKSVRRHVDELSEKDYASLYGVNSPDFVLMFMPTDGAFALAHQSDPDLFTLAMQKRVAIVSPSLLFPNLRTVEAIWRQERQNRNAEEIARQAGGLYDKFAGILEDLNSLGSHLRRAEETRDTLVSKLKDGRGNLLDRVERLRQLGARTKKRLEEGSEESPT